MRPFEAPGELHEEMKEIVWLCFLRKKKRRERRRRRKKERKKNSVFPNASFDINYIIVHEANFHQLYVRAQPSGNM